MKTIIAIIERPDGTTYKAKLPLRGKHPLEVIREYRNKHFGQLCYRYHDGKKTARIPANVGHICNWHYSK